MNANSLSTFGRKYSDLKRLSELNIGEKAYIHSFEKDEVFLKLMEMGCVPGELVEIEQVAMTGDPISILISGYNLSLRKSEAAHIFVTNTQNTDNQ